jgi:hypothetical protein
MFAKYSFKDLHWVNNKNLNYVHNNYLGPKHAIFLRLMLRWSGLPWTSCQYYYKEYQFYKIHRLIESLFHIYSMAIVILFFTNSVVLVK